LAGAARARWCGRVSAICLCVCTSCDLAWTAHAHARGHARAHAVSSHRLLHVFACRMRAMCLREHKQALPIITNASASVLVGVFTGVHACVRHIDLFMSICVSLCHHMHALSMYICTYMCVHIHCLHTHARARARTHTHAHINYVYTHTHTHTHTHTQQTHTMVLGRLRYTAAAGVLRCRSPVAYRTHSLLSHELVLLGNVERVKAAFRSLGGSVGKCTSSSSSDGKMAVVTGRMCV